jgi:hypothetical protein
MTNGQIEKLKILQADIAKVKKALDILRRHKEFNVHPYQYDSYYNYPIEMVEDLKEGIHDWMFDQFLGKELELENQLEELILCKEIKGESTFTPTEI